MLSGDASQAVIAKQRNANNESAQGQNERNPSNFNQRKQDAQSNEAGEGKLIELDPVYKCRARSLSSSRTGAIGHHHTRPPTQHRSEEEGDVSIATEEHIQGAYFAREEEKKDQDAKRSTRRRSPRRARAAKQSVSTLHDPIKMNPSTHDRQQSNQQDAEPCRWEHRPEQPVHPPDQCTEEEPNQREKDCRPPTGRGIKRQRSFRPDDGEKM